MAKAKPTGRPRVLADAATRGKLLSLLKVGISREDAAAQLGIDRKTILNEAKRDAAFSQSLMQAETTGKNDLILVLQRAADRDWKAAAWMLERKWWQEWSKRSPDHVPMEKVMSFAAQIMAVVLASVPQKYHQKCKAAIDLAAIELKRDK